MQKIFLRLTVRIGQVENRSDSIKIACDYISINNLDAIVQVSKQLRDHRCHSGGGEDVLQLNLTLWYAWQHLEAWQPQERRTSANFKCPIEKCDRTFNSENGILDHLSVFPLFIYHIILMLQ